MADDVLYQGVKGVTDLMVRPGLINLDFADVRAIMDEMGKAMMGTGEGDGEERALKASEKAIANPLLDEISLSGAKGVLINITGGNDLTLFELDEAANRIREEVDPDANIIVGSTLDTSLDGKMRVSVVATGIDASEVELKNTEETENKALARKINTNDQKPKTFESVEPFLFKDLEKPMESEEKGSEVNTGLQPISEERLKSEELKNQAFKNDDSEIEITNRSKAASVLSPNTEGSDYLEKSNLERKRFGINSLISKMTNSNNEDYLSKVEDYKKTDDIKDSNSEDDERVEIPAFLRRQAN
jgi:cell division protein FtsZ